jgi:hypothetical protein
VTSDVAEPRFASAIPTHSLSTQILRGQELLDPTEAGTSGAVGIPRRWVGNIEANAPVRVNEYGRLRAGTAHILDDDDALERERILSEGNLPRRLCLCTFRSTGTDLLIVRVDLDPANDENQRKSRA